MQLKLFLGTGLIISLLLASPVYSLTITDESSVEKPVIVQTTTKELAEKTFNEGLELQSQENVDVESLKGAIAKYEKALQLFKEANDLHGEAKTLGNLGIAFSHLGEYEKAISYFKDSLKLSQTEKNISNQIASLASIGRAYDHLKQPQQSIDYYKQALVLLKNTGEKAWEANILTEIGFAYKSLGNFEEGIAYFKQALAIYEAEKDFTYLARTFSTLGTIYSLSGNNQSAIEYYEKALPYWRSINSLNDLASTLESMGTITDNLGNYQQAINYHNQAISIWQSLGEKNQVAQSFKMLASVYEELGNIDISLSYKKQALAIWEILKDEVGQAEMFSLIGMTYYINLGNTEDALSYYEKALALWQSLNQPIEQANVLNAISHIYSQSENYKEAEKYLNISLQIFQKEKYPVGEATTLGKLALVHSLSGDKDQALIYLNQAIPTINKLTYPPFKVIELLRIASIYQFLGDNEQALIYYNQALPISQATGNRANESMILYHIAFVQRSQGNLKEALNNIESSIKIIENLRTNIGSQELRESYFATVQNYYQFYIDLLMELHQKNPDQGYDGQALQASESSRARSLVELLTESGANIRQGVDPKLLEQEQNLIRQLNALERLRQEPPNDSNQLNISNQLSVIKQKSESLLNQLDELKAQIRVTSPRYADLKYPKPANLQEIQQQVLDDNTLLLEYSLGAERSFLWAVTKNSITSYVLPSESEIKKVAETFQESVSLDSTGSIDSGLPLSKILLAPVESQLKNKRLLIVGDGILQYIPFVALPIPSAPNTPLLMQNEIVTLPSASTITIQRKQLENRSPATKTIAVLADPVYSKKDDRIDSDTRQNQQPSSNNRGISGIEEGPKQYNRLKSSTKEAQEILALVPIASNKLEALGFDASFAQATNENLAQYQIIHFSAHGAIDTENPELSSIVLSLYDETGQSQNGFLRLQDIFNLNLPAELVVLSACETALGKNVKGEGLVGLTRGFMYAGARRVVVSLWSVNDALTSQLMIKFYEKMLQNGQNPVTALREAQLEMWQSDQWRSPYYWAAFTVQGDWR